MRYIKLYEENISEEPKVGDYVIAKECIHPSYPQMLYDFVNNNAGLVVRKYKDKYSPLSVDVKYENVPKKLKEDYFFIDQDRTVRSFPIDSIVEFAPTKEQLFAKITGKKYNL